MNAQVLGQPKDSKIFQKDSNCSSPRPTKGFQKIPKDSKRLQKIPKDSKRFQNNP